ncbi:hypothetical protein Aple_081310 [Acrocarpospora pleiomorpha]|uniref:DUF4145 domain-containing protein n=1 Tax=Acrocarpospora pleiomorpha TaxID=90975 RepID=A0A5M3XW98_9ACTN|nr:DUF4145 domain-containing protein [Acrocarpospora pleiomorpha]GES25232.1 hypothetical protein Aple_081310 [Acrocarpospora pleiomorpha]
MTGNISSEQTEAEADRYPQATSHRYYCPHPDCSAFAHQISGDLWFRLEGGGDHPQMEQNWIVHRCQACRQAILWRFEKAATWGTEGTWTLIFPFRSVGPLANPDMPTKALEVYLEAQRVAPVSRRSAAALLRLALQIVVDDLVPGNEAINNKIGRLVEQGLLPQIQQSMDVLRVVGNNAVHPGQIDLEEDPDLVEALFMLVNLVVDQVISRPKQAQALFDALPEQNRRQIARRDGTNA